MADSNPLSLNQQLAQRAKTFCSNLGLAQNKLARLLKVDDSQFSRFLNGQANLNAEKTLKLVRLMTLSKRDLELRFGSPEKLTARLMHLQESGRELAKVVRFDNDDGWVPGLSGQDPNGTADITGVKTARDLPNADDYQQETIDFLKGQQNIYRSAIAEIDRYLAGIQRGKVNVTGTTSGPRTVPSNQTSRTPGPRAALLSVDPNEHLAWLQKEKQLAEEELELQKKIKAEQVAAFNARVKLLKFKEGKG
jgi:transcriptional regulator with XRE-family HTH domain